MKTIIFATCDITPKLWNDFRRTAAVPPSHNMPDAPMLAPDILVHSRTPNLDTETDDLSYTVTSDFKDATYAQLDEFISSLPYRRDVFAHYFMVLDEKSAIDGKLIIIEKDEEPVDENGEVAEELTPDEFEQLPRRKVWRRHRVPFDKVNDFCYYIEMKPGDEGDEFLEEVTKDHL